MLKNLTAFFLSLITNGVPLISSGMESDQSGAGATAVTPSYVWTNHAYRFGDLSVVLDRNLAQQKLTVNVAGPEGKEEQEADFLRILEPVRDLINIPGLRKVAVIFGNVKALLQGDFNTYFHEEASLSITGPSIYLETITGPRLGILTIICTTPRALEGLLLQDTITVDPVGPIIPYPGLIIPAITVTTMPLERGPVYFRVPLSATVERMGFSEDRMREILDMKETGEPNDAIFTAIGKTKEEIVNALEISEELREGALLVSFHFE